MHGGDSLFGRMSSTAHVYRDSGGHGGVDSELDHKAHRVTEKLSESINTIANEPSVAFYRIQEHVRKTLPQLVEQKHEVEEMQQQVQGACFDTEYAGNAVKNMQKSVVHFQNIQELLKNAMFMKQQIDYEEGRRPPGRGGPAGKQGEEGGGAAAEDGTTDMNDSAISTDSSLVASGHANTEEDDGNSEDEPEHGQQTTAKDHVQGDERDTLTATPPVEANEAQTASQPAEDSDFSTEQQQYTEIQ